MYIPPVINWAIPWLLRLGPTTHSPSGPLAADAPAPKSDSNTLLTFVPIHAHGHAWDKQHGEGGAPRLLFHDASSPSAYFSSPDTTAFSADEAEEHFLDSPLPHIASEPLSLRTKEITMRRPKTRPPSILSWALSSRRQRAPDTFPLPTSQGLKTGAWVAPDYTNDHGEWEDVTVKAPDISDRQTLITLAKMTSNAYVLPDGGEWWPTGKYNATIPFGWEPDADGLRGHVFADPKNETVIIAIKGTSAGVLGSGGPTAKNDKFNDNLLFSCCCARVDFSWSTVCDCYSGGYKCGQTCLEDALIEESVYATVGTNLYNNVTYMYPDANIWLVGHSLGGSVSALIGLSFGAPVLTIEAPGDRLPASRLHLPLPPGLPPDLTGITHLYHTADPIPMGTCTGGYSGCYAAGFAMESSCHTGQTILYDTVTVKGWSVDIRTHRIGEIINKVLADPWPVQDEVVRKKDDCKKLLSEKQPWYGAWWGWGRKGPKCGEEGDDDGDDGGDGDDDWERHGGVPKPLPESDCEDCYKWEFGEFDKKGI